MEKLILNVVTCGMCGDIFAHTLNVEELTCPYCKTSDDVSSFPDLFYPPEYNDSYIEVVKEKIKRKPVASVDGRGAMVIGVSDVIRWGDVVTVNGTDIDVAKAVELGKKYNVPTADILERDLKSDDGLLIMFPIAYLMDNLQRLPEIGTGAKLLELVKPDNE